MSANREIYLRARELLAGHWIQDDLVIEFRGERHFCLLGAIGEAMEGDPTIFDSSGGLWKATVLIQVNTAIGITTVTRYETLRDDVARWNDDRGRTEADVLALLDRLAGEGEAIRG